MHTTICKELIESVLFGRFYLIGSFPTINTFQ